jgi:hypothetical protein
VSRPTRVYVAGPYSKGIPDETMARVIDAAERLAAAGYVPFVPHTMTFLWAVRYQHSVDFWYRFDLHWLEACDALLRLPGESPGADAEVVHALDLGINVYMDIRTLIQDQPPPRMR